MGFKGGKEAKKECPMAHQDCIPANVLNRRVQEQDRAMSPAQKARAKALREKEVRKVTFRKEVEAYLERKAKASPPLSKEDAERRFFSTPSPEGKRRQMLLNREESRVRGDLRVLPFEGVLASMKEAKDLEAFGLRVHLQAEKIRQERNLQEEFRLLLEQAPPETIRAALELGGVDLSQELSPELLERLQEAVEVALDL
jgi:hypothetical protein